MTEHDPLRHPLRHHGDAEVRGTGLLDLAVNVRPGGPPRWLLDAVAAADLAAYPDTTRATAAVAARHGRDPSEVLLTAGAAEAFVLMARALSPRHAVCVHPSFTEPEAALRVAGHEVHRAVLAPPYDEVVFPDSADLVVVGNPTNPTGVLHHDLEQLCRPGRVTVVDEAFMDAVPDEPGSLAGRSDLPGLVVVRSLTKTWSLAGLRVGYLLAEPSLVQRLREVQPLWAVSAPALVAAEVCSTPDAVALSQASARALAVEREWLEREVSGLGVQVSPGSRAPFLLCRAEGHPEVRNRLRTLGIAVRRGDTFPGLGPEHWRTAVRDRAASERLVGSLWGLLAAF